MQIVRRVHVWSVDNWNYFFQRRSKDLCYFISFLLSLEEKKELKFISQIDRNVKIISFFNRRKKL